MRASLRSLHGGTLLALDCLGGVVGIVEQMHATIRQRPLPWQGSSADAPRRTGPIASGVYTALRGTHQYLRTAIDRSIRAFADAPPSTESSDSIETQLAILNGVCGDYLESTGNPLAIPMTLRTLEKALDLTPPCVPLFLPHATSKIVVLVHGLCLSETAWHRGTGVDLGERLREALGYTPVYVRYNTGRHISTNGQELSELLERLLGAWPVPIESIVLVGHSMGGLVVRSAGAYGDRSAKAWRNKLSHIICLGTPHHGSSLERGGHAVTSAMRAFPYLEPFAVGKMRSAGIKDLRYGNLLDEDWQAGDADGKRGDMPVSAPMLDGVTHCFAAATVGRHAQDRKGYLFGDLLVAPPNAVGAHDDVERRLRVPPECVRLFYGINHFGILDHPDVHDQIVKWIDRSPSASQ